MRMIEWSPAPSDLNILVRALVDGQADLIDITTPSTPGTDLEIKHGLGRIPRGAWIVNGDPGVNLAASLSSPSLNLTTGGVVDRDSYMFNYLLAIGDGASRYLQIPVGPTPYVTSATAGVVLPDAGSVVGISGQVRITSGQAGETFTLEARINGSNVFSVTSGDLSATGEKNVYATQAAGIDTFSAGDILAAYITKSGAVALYDYALCWIQVAYGSTTVVTDVDLTGGSVDLSIPYDLTGYASWTNEFLYLRFPVASAALTIAVF